MPLYNMRCKNEQCGEVFEKRVSLDDVDREVKVPCPKCESDSEREITGLKTTSTTWKHWRL